MFDGKFFSAQQYFTITRHNKYMYTFDSKHYYNQYQMMPKRKSKDSSQNESKAKQAQDAYPANRYVGSKLQFGDEMKKMFGLLFQRQVATLFKGFKDNGFYLCEKFMYLQDNHAKNCQELIDFMKNKIKEVQKQMNIQKGDDLENSDKEEQIKNLYKEIFKDNDKLNSTFVELLAPTPKNITEDFDVMIEGVHKYEVLHNKIIKNFQNKSKQESNEIWTLQNYLQLDRKDNQWTRSIFEMKRNLLTEKEKSQAVYVVQEDQEQQQMQKKHKEFRCLLKIHAQKVKNMDQFPKHLEDSSVFRTLTQLMKLAIAGKFYNLNVHGGRMKSMDIEDFQNLKPMTYKKEDLPIIDLYLVINSNIKQQQFKSCFDFFKPILRYWFDSVGAILHVIGFTKRSKHQIDIQKELQRQGKEIEIMNDRIKQLQYCMKKLMENNENEKIKNQEDKEDRKEDKK